MNRRRSFLVTVAIAAPIAAGVAGFLFAFRAPVPTATEPNVIRDGSGLVRVVVRDVRTPASTEEVQQLLRTTSGPVSIGGARFSMGGQIATPGAIFIDTRARLNDVLELDAPRKRVRVAAGITWRKLQEAIDPLDLSVEIMQTYDNFTVGGTLSVNGHGRYVGLGPVVQSVRAIDVVLADGTRKHATREENPELFWGAIGGYGGLGVITEVELDLADNVKVERVVARMPLAAFPGWFDANVRAAPDAVFFNADLYPPDCDDLTAQLYVRTEQPLTDRRRLQSKRLSTASDRFVYWLVTDGPGGKTLRSRLIDRIRLARPEVVWRNFEASYDVGTLEPTSRDERTYVLQEYFVPVARLAPFVGRMRGVFQDARVNVLNVSIRHAAPDPGTLLAWAPQECFALVVYYAQPLDPISRDAAGAWTRRMIDEVLAEGGTYYLPYELHATPDQFRRAYPRAAEYFALKRQVDPQNRFRNALWDKYMPQDR